MFWVAFFVWALGFFLVAVAKGPERSGKVGKGWVFYLPLTERVKFKAELQRRTRIQVPKYVVGASK